MALIFRNVQFSIHPSNVPWVYHPLVSNAHLTIIFHEFLPCAILFRMYINSLHRSFISSSHSLFGLPLFVFSSISPNTTSFTSLLSSILQMCANVHHTTIGCYISFVGPVYIVYADILYYAGNSDRAHPGHRKYDCGNV